MVRWAGRCRKCLPQWLFESEETGFTTVRELRECWLAFTRPARTHSFGLEGFESTSSLVVSSRSFDDAPSINLEFGGFEHLIFRLCDGGSKLELLNFFFHSI